MSRLKVEAGSRPGRYVARKGEATALLVAHVVNGLGVYGFDEEHPDAVVEHALARVPDRRLGRMLLTADQERRT